MGGNSPKLDFLRPGQGLKGIQLLLRDMWEGRKHEVTL